VFSLPRLREAKAGVYWKVVFEEPKTAFIRETLCYRLSARHRARGVKGQGRAFTPWMSATAGLFVSQALSHDLVVFAVYSTTGEDSWRPPESRTGYLGMVSLSSDHT
jgi:hypothetical protein